MTLLSASNNATTRLVADVTATDTFFDVENASPFPDPPFRVWVNEEIIEVETIDRVANRFSNLIRGVENTTPAFHPVGSFVENVFTAGTYDELVTAINSKETPEGAQQKADTAETNAKAYADQKAGERVSKSGDTMTGNLTLPAIDGDWYIPDTRSVPINPDDLQRRVSVDFKSGSTIGLSGSTYFVVYTIRPWTDGSGGVTHQVAFGDNGVFHRKSSGSSWGAWNKILDETGGTLKGILTAYSNTSYTVRQMRNIILSTSDPNVSAMQDGDIWIKYK